MRMASSPPSPPKPELPPVRLLVFGDSWVRSHVRDLRTWPELLGDRLGWLTVNAAMPGSGSDMLLQQADDVEQLLSERSATLHEETWALVHSGGNDLLRGINEDFVNFVTRSAIRSMCCCSACCCPIRIFDEIGDNMEALIERLHDDLGVKNVILVGLPLTTMTPFISQLLGVLFEEYPCLARAAKFVVRRLNSVFNAGLRRRLRRFRRRANCEVGGWSFDAVRTLVIDEADCIEVCSGGSGKPTINMWNDGIHPTQSGHEALCREIYSRLEFQFADPPSRGRCMGSSGATDSESDEETSN